MRELLTLSNGTVMPMPWGHPGPQSGQGRGPGRPFRGIVEDTPCLWISWLVALARGYGKRPDELGGEANGECLAFRSVQLTFGERWYFACPGCGRHCEALYLVEGYYACRRCHHLGYVSQTHRPGSPEAFWQEIMRPARGLPRRYFGAVPVAQAFEAMLRERAEHGIHDIMASIRFRV